MVVRARKITDADKRAAAKVRALWTEYKKKNPGISQEIAASRAGMTQSAFSQFLQGTVPMRITPVVKMAKFFGVAPAAIRDDMPDLIYTTAGRTTILEVKEPESSKLSSAALEVARIFDSLEPQTRELIREQIFIYSVVDRSYPWLRRGRPKGESYESFEKRHVENMAVKLALEARRIAKIKP